MLLCQPGEAGAAEREARSGLVGPVNIDSDITLTS